MKAQRNCSIDILRLFFAIEIVALHSNPLIEFNQLASYLFSQVFSRLAVPFFAAVAGYFYFHHTSINRHIASLKKYIVIYTFWTVLMLVYDAVMWKEDVAGFGEHVLRVYFLEGWHHLWYLLAIIYMIVVLLIAEMLSVKLFEVLYKLSILLMVMGVLITNYGNVFFRIPFPDWITRILQSEYFCNVFIIAPFFMLGYKLNNPDNERNNKGRLKKVVICCAGLMGEVLFTTCFDLHRNVILCIFTYPIVYFLMTWALNEKESTHSTLARYSSGMASIIYFGHFLLMMILVSQGVTETMVFVICVLSMACLGAAVTKINNPVLNKVI